MVDINFIRENTQIVKKAVNDKNINLNVDELLEVDVSRRELISKVEELRQVRNEAAKTRDIEKGKQIKQELDHLEEDLGKVEDAFKRLMVLVPTVPSPDTPVGKSDEDNVEVYSWGEKPKFDFEPKDHVVLGKELDVLDLERGAKVGGYRGYFVKNEGVLLQMGIMMYALNKMIEKSYKPMIPPTLVKEFVLFGSGYFKGLEYNPETDEIYKVGSSDKNASGVREDNKFLVGTAEPSLLAYFSDEVLKEEDLPLRLVGFSQCYRSEIGSYGKDTKGLYRVHEFMKVEQIVISRADIEESNKLQEEMMKIVDEMHKELGLSFRRVQICTGDMSAGKYQAFDIEVWLPGLNRYGETGSASNFVDWQARRLNARYADKEGIKKYVYMLNNTTLPTARIFIAILENFQQKDGSVVIPEVLRKYTGFDAIKPKA